MVAQESLLVKLVACVDRLPMPSAPRKRGHPYQYPDRLFLKALVIMIVRRLHKVQELLSVLEQPTPEMQQLRALLTPEGHYPSRRTGERRLKALPATLPAQIGCVGRYLVALIQPWATCGRAIALDSTVLRAQGGVWHKKDREAGVVPHSSIDQEAHWTRSRWHGFFYGWKLHLATLVAGIWIPLAAELTPANVADNEMAPALLREVPLDTRAVLGDLHYNAPNVQQACDQQGRLLICPHYGPYPHTDDGVAVRRLFHKLRSVAMENFHEHFKGIFEGHGQVPTKGLIPTQRFVLGAILVYQIAVLYRFEHQLPLNMGLKPFLKAA